MSLVKILVVDQRYIAIISNFILNYSIFSFKTIAKIKYPNLLLTLENYDVRYKNNPFSYHIIITKRAVLTIF